MRNTRLSRKCEMGIGISNGADNRSEASIRRNRPRNTELRE